MLNPDDWDEEELRLVRDISRNVAIILAILLVGGLFFTGCGLLVVIIAA